MAEKTISNFFEREAKINEAIKNLSKHNDGVYQKTLRSFIEQAESQKNESGRKN